MMILIRFALVAFLTSAGLSRVLGQSSDIRSAETEINQMVIDLMDRGDIPGLSMVIISRDQQILKSYGHSNLADRTPVSTKTLFELGSCSKAFTSIAALKLVDEGKLDLDSSVSYYLPWFRVLFEGRIADVKVKHLLHHTSGIPWNTISQIPPSLDSGALEQTIRTLVDNELNNKPGTQYEYATINYDVVALIIEKISGISFERFAQREVLQPLGLLSTTIGEPVDRQAMAKGHKVSFFHPWNYQAPVFKGNNAAGYFISNAEDMGRWLQFQMGMFSSQLYDIAMKSQERDESVPLHNMSSYAMGWEISLNGTGEIYHGGLNPAFTSYMAFRPQRKIGVVVLANSNSNMTASIGDRAMKILASESLDDTPIPENRLDTTFSIVAIVLALYLVFTFTWFIWVTIEAVRGKRKLSKITLVSVRYMVAWLGILCPFLFGVYILPKAIAGFTWDALFVWMPFSFSITIFMVVASIMSTYVLYIGTVFFPENDKLKAAAPRLVLFSLLSGIANMAIIVLITSSIGSNVELKYLIFYYVLAVSVYILGRRYVQVNLIKLSRQLTYEIRVELLDKIFAASYQNFEKIDTGRIHTTLNDDVNMLGESANLFVMLITSIFTAVAVFIYLASIAFWATVITLSLILSLTVLYFFVVKNTHKYFAEARDTRDRFTNYASGLINGFKEISLHNGKKLNYREDMAYSAYEFKEKITTANVRFATAYMVGESLLVVILGVVVFAIPELFPTVELRILMSFVILLLYLIGPINSILNSIPTIVQFRVALNRINEFLGEISVVASPVQTPVKPPVDRSVDSLSVSGITFQYKGKQDKNRFAIGPIDLEVRKGEVLFIIGGNGSGKTTFAKLLSGLYKPDGGLVMLNNKIIEPAELSEFFSAVFNPPYLFEKLYGIDIQSKSKEAKHYLEVLELNDKLTVSEDGMYNTINLSSGQRKRMALLQCYLEDSPIYLLDEWAVDQDPAFRRFFYRTLVPQMKKQGKIVIAITHDDHYFDVADRILKMNNGKLEHM
jgi:putative ATP-binding cassette transporter